MNQLQIRVDIAFDKLDHLAITTETTIHMSGHPNEAWITIHSENGSEVVFRSSRTQDLDLLIKKLMEARIQLEISQKKAS